MSNLTATPAKIEAAVADAEVECEHLYGLNSAGDFCHDCGEVVEPDYAWAEGFDED